MVTTWDTSDSSTVRPRADIFFSSDARIQVRAHRYYTATAAAHLPASRLRMHEITSHRPPPASRRQAPALGDGYAHPAVRARAWYPPQLDVRRTHVQRRPCDDVPRHRCVVSRVPAASSAVSANVCAMRSINDSDRVLAGFAWPPPATYDGSSLMSCAAFDSSQALWATAADAASPAASGSRSLQATKRRSALVEYHGEGGDGGEGSPVCSLTAGQDLFGGRDGNYTLPPFWYGRNVCVIQVRRGARHEFWARHCNAESRTFACAT